MKNYIEEESIVLIMDVVNARIYFLHKEPLGELNQRIARWPNKHNVLIMK